MSDPVGYLVWVIGTRAPEPQRWSDLPRAIGSDYWSEKAGRVLLAIPLS